MGDVIAAIVVVSVFAVSSFVPSASCTNPLCHIAKASVAVGCELGPVENGETSDRFGV